MNRYTPLIIFLTVVVTLGSMISGAEMRDSGWEMAAIAHECAQHNPETGVFEWLK